MPVLCTGPAKLELAYFTHDTEVSVWDFGLKFARILTLVPSKGASKACVTGNKP